MGARNASGVRLMWGHLPDGAYRLLFEMAQTALDEDGRDIRTGEVIPARRFFGGEDTLVTYVRSHNDRGEVRSHAAKKSAAYRFLAQLVDAGAVKIVRAATGGSRSWYALNVDLLNVEEFAALDDRAINRRPQSPSRSDSGESEPVGLSESEPVGLSESEPVGLTPYALPKEVLEELQPRKTGPEVSTSPAPAVGVHTTTDGRSWEDVPLITVDTAGYAEANAFLERTIGTSAASSAVAGYIAAGCPSYHDAVVTAAWNAGWEPEGPP
jgi:hypothetical protein